VQCPINNWTGQIASNPWRQTGGSQVVKTLRRGFVGEAFGAFQLHHQRVFDKEIGKVLSDRVALVGNGKRRHGFLPIGQRRIHLRPLRLQRQGGSQGGIRHGGPRGDLVIHLDVRTPTRLTPEQRKLLEQLRDSLPVDSAPAEKGLFDKVRDYFA